MHSIFQCGRASALAISLATLGGASSIAFAQTDPATEQRRGEERERAQRERLETRPDIRRDAPALAPHAWPIGEAPCVPISRITLEGDSADRFQWALAAVADGDDAAIGRCLGAKGVQVAASRVQQRILADGWVTTRVLVAPQGLAGGYLTLTLIPGRVHGIRLREGATAARAGLRNGLPVKPGELLNLRDIEQGLENLKRVPTAEADIQIEPASTGSPGDSDLVVQYAQAFPFRVALSVDNSGTGSTGRYQGGATVSYDNWWTLNDLFYVSWNHDLGGGDEGERGTRGRSVHYSVPWGAWLAGATVSSYRYHQSVSGPFQDYTYSGRSDNAEFKVSRVLWRDAARKTSASLKAWQRRASNYIDDTEIEVQRRTTGGWEFGVSHREHLGSSTINATLDHRHGTGAFGATAAPEELFGEGTSRLAMTNAQVSVDSPFQLGGLQLRYAGQWRKQWNHTPLTPQDRFAIGGRYTVRGFDGESSLSAERGWLLRNDLAVVLGGSHEVYFGIDYGRVRGPSEKWLSGQSLTGAVIGLRGSAVGVSYDFFIGGPIQRPEYFRTAHVTGGFQLNYGF